MFKVIVNSTIKAHNKYYNPGDVVTVDAELLKELEEKKLVAHVEEEKPKRKRVTKEVIVDEETVESNTRGN